MVNCGSLLKCAVFAIVLVSFSQSSSATEKLATCCKIVTREEITEPILGYLVQKRNPPCVQAIIFQTKSGLYCSQLNAPWVRRKIVAFEKAKAQSTTVPPTRVSLLSLITSTASPPSSSTPLPSSSLPSTSEMPVDETISQGDSE